MFLSTLAKEKTLDGRNKIIENIKILLYKENQNIFEQLDFEDEDIYLEPLLFAYYSDLENKENNLQTILYGYTNPKLRSQKVNVKSDGYSRIYLPNLGWLITDCENCYYDLIKQGSELQLMAIDNRANFIFEPLNIINGTKIELLNYPIPCLDQYYFDSELNPLDVEIENISKIHKEHLTKALNLIKQYVPNYYELIELVVKKMVVFNFQPIGDSEYVLRNSFAILNGMGIAFFNAYQEDYNEVFFVDDIAHQTGHVIFYAMTFHISDFISVEPSSIIQKLSNETRSIYIVYHALFTYYSTFVCLDTLLKHKVFKGEKEIEAQGRILFYINKCNYDISLIENFDNQLGKKDLFTTNGKRVFDEIKQTFQKVSEEWLPLIGHYDLSNQPYNFSYSKFKELNSIN